MVLQRLCRQCLKLLLCYHFVCVSDGYYGSGLVVAAKGAKATMVETEAYTTQGGCEVV